MLPTNFYTLAKTIHGRETRAIRTLRAEKLVELTYYYNITLKFTGASKIFESNASNNKKLT